VNGAWYEHSAAKFWPRLLADLSERFADWEEAALSAPGEAVWDAGVLDPTQSLRHDLEHLTAAEAAQIRTTLLDELLLYGPPAGVQLQVLGPERKPIVDEAVESVDAETFLYLSGWLLHWAGIPGALWSMPVLQGTLRTGLRRPQILPFTFAQRRLAEGLTWRSVTVRRPHTQAASS
jgi:hypothetical protein